MVFLKKINLRRYFFRTTLCGFVGLFFDHTPKYILGLATIYFATVLNHALLVEGVDLMIFNPKKLTSKQVAIRGFILFFAKLVVLLGGIYIGILFMGDKVIIPVIFYVICIFILVFSIKKLDEVAL